MTKITLWKCSECNYEQQNKENKCYECNTGNTFKTSRKITEVQRRKEWLGHDYTTCQDGCINRVAYCGCFHRCNSCNKHGIGCKNDFCKSCMKQMR